MIILKDSSLILLSWKCWKRSFWLVILVILASVSVPTCWRRIGRHRKLHWHGFANLNKVVNGFSLLPLALLLQFRLVLRTSLLYSSSQWLVMHEKNPFDCTSQYNTTKTILTRAFLVSQIYKINISSVLYKLNLTHQSAN